MILFFFSFCGWEPPASAAAKRTPLEGPSWVEGRSARWCGTANRAVEDAVRNRHLKSLKAMVRTSPKSDRLFRVWGGGCPPGILNPPLTQPTPWPCTWVFNTWFLGRPKIVDFSGFGRPPAAPTTIPEGGERSPPPSGFWGPPGAPRHH